MSSFRKRNVQKPIPGTRTSPQTGQMITSSGIPSLDLLLGGGLPIGSICLIEEDEFVTNAKVLAKYFLAEGVASHQAIFLGSLDDAPAELIRKLPKQVDNEEIENASTAEGEPPKNGLRIAWRYNDLPMINSEQAMTKIGHNFNLMEPMDPFQLTLAEITLWNHTDEKTLPSEQSQHRNDEEGENEEQPKNKRDETFDDLINAENDDGVKILMDIVNQTLPVDNDTEQYLGQFLDPPLRINRVNTQTVNSTEKYLGQFVSPPSRVEREDEQTLADQMATKKETCSTTTTTSSNTQEKAKIFGSSKYLSVLADIQALLSQDEFVAGAMGKKALARVCITSLGSPMWYDEHFGKDLLKLLTVLRASVRNAYAVCLLTMPMHLISKYDATLVPKLRNLVDYAIELESFAGSEKETNPAFKEYSGLLHMRKVSAINSLCVYKPDTLDLAFKLRRKKFVIEKLHLPPELQESPSDAGASHDIVPSMSCSSASSSNASLDF